MFRIQATFSKLRNLIVNVLTYKWPKNLNKIRIFDYTLFTARIADT